MKQSTVSQETQQKGDPRMDLIKRRFQKQPTGISQVQEKGDTHTGCCQPGRPTEERESHTRAGTT